MPEGEPFEVAEIRRHITALQGRVDVLQPAVDEYRRLRDRIRREERSLAGLLGPPGEPASRRPERPNPSVSRLAPVADELKVQKVLKGGGPVSLGVITSRSGLPSRRANVVLAGLADRGVVRQLPDGTYELAD